MNSLNVQLEDMIAQKVSPRCEQLKQLSDEADVKLKRSGRELAARDEEVEEIKKLIGNITDFSKEAAMVESILL
jgi:hypothetical protein